MKKIFLFFGLFLYSNLFAAPANPLTTATYYDTAYDAYYTSSGGAVYSNNISYNASHPDGTRYLTQWNGQTVVAVICCRYNGIYQTLTYYGTTIVGGCPSDYTLNETNECIAPPPDCSLIPNSTLNIDTYTCDCDINFILSNSLCEDDKNNNGILDTVDPDADIDGDGIPNSIDLDDDGDGVTDSIDPDHSDYDPFKPESACGKWSTSPLVVLGEAIYGFNDYSYVGVMTDTECNNILSTPIVDSILIQPDSNLECSSKYCFAHYISKNCSFIPESYAPNGFEWVYKNFSPSTCVSKVDMVNYIDSNVILPDIQNCPDTSFCFLKVPTKKTDENNQTAAPDINSTSIDLQPLLKVAEDTNLNLEDIKDKIDNSNLSLEEISKTSTNQLSTTQDFKKSFDDFSLSSGTWQKNLLGESKSSNSKLDTINDNILLANKNLKSIASTNSNISGGINKVVDALYSGLGLNSDGSRDDGSSSLSGYQSTVTNSFSGFVDNNMFGFANQAYTVPTVSFDMRGKTFVLFSPDKLAPVDVASIRSMLLFVFAIAGFITVFKTI